eukprot:2660903-Pleurochrysis_carterae.AAC.1
MPRLKLSSTSPASLKLTSITTTTTTMTAVRPAACPQPIGMRCEQTMPSSARKTWLERKPRERRN